MNDNDNETFERFAAEAARLQELAGGLDGWLELFPVQEEDGKVHVRVFPGAMYKFDVDASDMAQNIVAVLRARLEAFEAALAK